MADSVSGWASYRQCDTERDHFPLESWRFLQIISYCLLISVLSMTCLSSGPACNQIQPAAEVAVWVLWSRGLVFWVCLLGEAIYQHEVFRHRQAHTLLAEASVHIVSHSDPTVVSSEISNHIDLLATVYFKPAETLARLQLCGVRYLVNIQSNKQVVSFFLQSSISLTCTGNFPPIPRSWGFSYRTGAPSSKLMYEPRCEHVRAGMIWVEVRS